MLAHRNRKQRNSSKIRLLVWILFLPLIQTTVNTPDVHKAHFFSIDHALMHWVPMTWKSLRSHHYNNWLKWETPTYDQREAWLDFIGTNPETRIVRQHFFLRGGGGAALWFCGDFCVVFVSMWHMQNCISNTILTFICICLNHCGSGSCQLLSTCAPACSEQPRPRRQQMQRKPVLTRFVFWTVLNSKRTLQI